ncbi:peroxidase 27 [Prunus yedoensis var. nudiflora]|uniref:Peroxidase n=1 Tax=Prunus yedoensis var. nudiflora TaxID=2094558 RepID=A0A314Y8K8_PRUYE|nr:peroxidase 27 [Prunus yedoensis var. nudiflora]
MLGVNCSSSSRGRTYQSYSLMLLFNDNLGEPIGGGLKVGFYAKSCPEAEDIVKKVIFQTISTTPSLAGPLLRMHFHDCFVRIIDKAKSALEKACPGVVSCADVVAITARDVVSATNGAHWDVETGRRDGRVSNITEAFLNLLPPTANITILKAGFAQKGLSAKDLVVLSGGHTIGTSHCTSFSNRLYNFTGKGDTDPTLDPNYIARLKLKCKPNDQKTLVEMDPGSFKTFDQTYFTLVTKRRGLFQSDAALLDDSETKAYVQSHAAAVGKSSFFKDFGVSMVNMGRIGVLTGNAGEIRKVCSKIN